MNKIYISIGAHCTTPTLFDNLHIKKESLPFDWMFSTPEFVYTILKLLLIDNMPIEDIVDNHFFKCDKLADFLPSNPSNYITNINGHVLINSKYNVCFPHDTLGDRDKYIRRLERLKEIIINSNNFLYFVYVSVPSTNSGYFKIDCAEPIKEIYHYIHKINLLIKDITTNYKILIFDTDINPKVSTDKTHIFNYRIRQKKTWQELLPELIHKFKI
jgi:hypothetical protein